MDIKILPALVEDVTSLKRLAKRSLETDVDASEEERAFLLPHIQEDIEKSVNDENCLFLKLATNEILGYILVKDNWNLMHLFIEPSQTKKGLGKKLIREAISKIKNRANLGYIALNSSRNAVPFYKSVGFKVDESRKPKSESSTPMRLEL